MRLAVCNSCQASTFTRQRNEQPVPDSFSAPEPATSQRFIVTGSWPCRQAWSVFLGLESLLVSSEDFRSLPEKLGNLQPGCRRSVSISDTVGRAPPTLSELQSLQQLRLRCQTPLLHSRQAWTFSPI